MPEFAEGWESFYMIVGAAAGALIGLQFVVLTLIAEKPPKDAAAAGSAFATPTIVHFSVSLLISALMRVPWPNMLSAAISWGIMGLGGVFYTAFVARRMIKQQAYQPGFEDWLFHVVVPVLTYALLLPAALFGAAHPEGAFFAVAGVSLLLLFIGIHNAWDAIAYHVFVNMRAPKGETGHKNKEKEKT